MLKNERVVVYITINIFEIKKKQYINTGIVGLSNNNIAMIVEYKVYIDGIKNNYNTLNYLHLRNNQLSDNMKSQLNSYTTI